MYNRAILIGRLTADPEMRTTPNGINVASFRIAVDRPFSKGAERKADFITITCWRQQAEFVCRYFSKGRAIGVEGSIQTRDYTDRDGNKRNTFEIVADRVFFVESKGAAGGSTASSAVESNSGVSYASGSAGDFQVISDDDDLPF
ncbi:MAG: single-stranded DNA-binding protein [Oscillospiraceae bacterium]|nr:single-stranded DNA-binding protein [Oscillospiraceae bacterium]